MPIQYRLLVGLVILTIAFFWFRYLMRSGKARKAFDMQERESKSSSALRAEEKRVQVALEDRRKDLLRQKEEISKELEQ